MAETTQEATQIQQVEVDSIEAILGTPGGDNLIVPTGEQKKPSFFSKEKVDMKFVNDPPAPEKKEEPKPEGELQTQAAADKEKASKAATTEKEAEALKEVLNEVIPEVTDEEKEKGGEAGRPKVNKDALVESTKKLIEEGLLVPFDDGKAIEDYTGKDFEELYKANIADKEAQIKEKTPLEFFDSLPEELQVAAKYHADGGKDLKTLFKILSEVEESRDLDPTKEADQALIVKEYLRATKFGNEDEIAEEINAWKDRGELDKKAEKFKPKLDAMQEQRVAQKLAQQERIKNQQLEASKHYVNDVYKTLEPANLNGIKLDKKTQGMLYSGLVQPNYPSISGRPTNLLGHLLEKYQYVEPNHALIAEALYLLADPEGYKAKIKEQGTTAAVEKTVRQLKTAEADKKSSSTVVEKDEVKTRTLPRNDNFFKRT